MEVAGTAVGIASLGIQLCQGLLQYYKAWKGYKDDIQSTYDCIEQFQQTLILLGKAAARTSHSPELVQRVADSIVACEGGIDRLGKKFEKIKGKTSSDLSALESLRRQLQLQGRHLMYPFRESTLAKLREIISELQGNILTATSALNIDIASSPLQKLETLDQRTLDLTTTSLAIRTGLEHSIQQNVQLVNSQKDFELEQAYAWLNAPNPFREYSKAVSEHHAGSGSWFLDGPTFGQWKTTPGTLCCIRGKPGCGKTVLSSVIVRHLKADGSRPTHTAMAYFFFNFNDRTKTMVHKLVRSLILQLSVQLPNGQTELVNRYTRYRNAQEDLSYNALVACLQKMLTVSQLYIVLDALDECEEQHRLTQFIHDVLGSHSERVHFLVTSRNEDCLKALQTSLLSLDVDLENEHVHADLRSFIQESVSGDEELGSWSADVQEEITTTLIAGSECMFRWVALQLEQLRKCYTLDGLRSTLTALPRGLEDTYVRILANIPEPNRVVVLKLLYWIIFAEMPLDLAAAADTTKLDINDNMFYSEQRRLRNPRTLLRLSPSLITLVAKADPSDPDCITLSHASVKDFLLSSAAQNDAVRFFHVSPSDGPLYVAETCVAYLLHMSEEVDDFRSPHWYMQKFKKYPLLEYLRMFWDAHVRKAQTRRTTRLNSLVLKFVRSKLLSETLTLFACKKAYPIDLSPLLRMAELGFNHGIEELLNAGHGANEAIDENWTALSVAAAAGRKDTVDVLLHHNALQHATSEAGNASTTCELLLKMAAGMEACTDPQLCEAVAARLLDAGTKLESMQISEIGRHTLEHSENDSLEVFCRLSRYPAFRMALSTADLVYSATLQYMERLQGMSMMKRP